MGLTGKPTPTAKGTTPNSGSGSATAPTAGSAKPPAQYAPSARVTADRVTAGVPAGTDKPTAPVIK